MIRRQFHHEDRQRPVLEDHTGQQQAGQDGHQDAGGVHGEDQIAGRSAEKGRAEDDVDRQARPAAHEDGQEARDPAVDGVLQRARGVDGRDVAAKADQHRQEAIAVQSQLLHKAIHHKGGAGQVAAVLQHGNRQVEEGQHRHEDQHAAHPGDHPIHKQALNPGAAQPYRRQQGQRPARDRAADHPIDPVDIGHAGVGRDLEDQPHHRQKDRHAPHVMGQDAVDAVGAGESLTGRPADHAAQQIGDEAVTAVGDQGMGVLAC